MELLTEYEARKKAETYGGTHEETRSYGGGGKRRGRKGRAPGKRTKRIGERAKEMGLRGNGTGMTSDFGDQTG